MRKSVLNKVWDWWRTIWGPRPIRTYYETRSSKNLDLSWPESVTYDIGNPGPEAGNQDGEYAATAPVTRNPTAVTTYNGIPVDVLGNAQKLSGDEIRVLTLNRGGPGDILIGSLRKVRLSESDPIEYEPLSYTWKDYDTVGASDNNTEDDVHPALFLSDTEHYISLKSNCAKALSSVRKQATDRTIWVDSICVNQEDRDERSHQVDMMKRIYAKAFTVLVYLGQASQNDDSDMAMSLLGRLRQSNRLDRYEQSCLTHLFQRPYFQRMWIVQEVALAKTLELYCGAKKAHVSAFAGKPMETILKSGFPHPPWLKNSKHTFTPLQQPRATSQAEHVLSLLANTASCHCSDDRDRIFALFGLLDAAEEDHLTADYTLSTEQVYAGISAFLITKGLMRNVLMLATRLVPTTYSDLPSWVPDWSQLGDAQLKDVWASEQSVLNPRTLELGPGFGVSGAGVITIQGVPIGPVIQTGSGITSGSVWTLLSPDGLGLHDAERQCRFQFPSRCLKSSSERHLAFLLPNYSTVLILRRDDIFSDQYTLVQIGEPTPWTKFSLIQRQELLLREHRVYLQEILPSFDSEHPAMWVILASSGESPLPSEFPDLWSQESIASAMSLIHSSIRDMGTLDLRERILWLKWQQYAHRGIQMLRDKKMLQCLIDEVTTLSKATRSGINDWEDMEKDAGLYEPWSLDAFLGLFIGEMFENKSTAWPDMRSYESQSFNGRAAVRHLMRWAKVTYCCLNELRTDIVCGLPWLKQSGGSRLYSAAIDKATSQVRIAGSHCQRGGVSYSSDRSLFLLREVFCQHSETFYPKPKDLKKQRYHGSWYWDLGEFVTVMKKRTALLRYNIPGLEKLETLSELQRSDTDFTVLLFWQLSIVLGVNVDKMDFTQIRIR